MYLSEKRWQLAEFEHLHRTVSEPHSMADARKLPATDASVFTMAVPNILLATDASVSAPLVMSRRVSTLIGHVGEHVFRGLPSCQGSRLVLWASRVGPTPAEARPPREG